VGSYQAFPNALNVPSLSTIWLFECSAGHQIKKLCCACCWASLIAGASFGLIKLSFLASKWQVLLAGTISPSLSKLEIDKTQDLRLQAGPVRYVA
jgi:hypothetical protein